MFRKASTSRRSMWLKSWLLVALISTLVISSSRLQADSGNCGGTNITLPFTDVQGNAFFCQIAQIYAQGITTGTSATTYSPTGNVTREQMAAFLGRTLDTTLQRGSQRAALDQFWTSKTPYYDFDLGTTSLSGDLLLARSDGFNVWVADLQGGNVYRVRASDGALAGTWTGATGAYGILCAMGKVFVTGDLSPDGSLYMIDPAASPGAVTTINNGLGALPQGIAFDGNKIWTANNGSISIIEPDPALPWALTNRTGFGRTRGFAYDGANMWVTDTNSLKKLDSGGNVIQTVTVGDDPWIPAFDGKNIWVPNHNSDTVTVVRASTGEVIATLSHKALDGPRAAAFDGERILVTNDDGDSVFLWKASDLTPIGTFSTGAGTRPLGACSDGQYFWVTLRGTDQLVRF